MGCSFPFCASPSTVSRSPSSACAASIQQALIELPFSITPQPQQSPVPQISFVPFRCWAWSTSSSVSPGSKCHLTARPFTVSAISNSGMSPLLSLGGQSRCLAQSSQRGHRAHLPAICCRGSMVGNGPYLVAYKLSCPLKGFFCCKLAGQNFLCSRDA